MLKDKRQGDSDRPTLTRSQVAKQLQRDVSWVRRREGTDLHPTVEGGVHRFSQPEVDALEARLEAERTTLEASNTVTVEVHRMFDAHLRSSRRLSVEGIAERVGLDPRTVRAMFVKWADEFVAEVPRLLSRRELRAIEQREEHEEREAEREHVERMAAMERESQEFSRRLREDADRARRERDAQVGEHEKRRARRRRELDAAMENLRTARANPGFAEQLKAIAEATTLDQVVAALLKLRSRG